MRKKAWKLQLFVNEEREKKRRLKYHHFEKEEKGF